MRLNPSHATFLGEKRCHTLYAISSTGILYSCTIARWSVTRICIWSGSEGGTEYPASYRNLLQLVASIEWERANQMFTGLSQNQWIAKATAYCPISQLQGIPPSPPRSHVWTLRDANRMSERGTILHQQQYENDTKLQRNINPVFEVDRNAKTFIASYTDY